MVRHQWSAQNRHKSGLEGKRLINGGLVHVKSGPKAARAHARVEGWSPFRVRIRIPVNVRPPSERGTKLVLVTEPLRDQHCAEFALFVVNPYADHTVSVLNLASINVVDLLAAVILAFPFRRTIVV